MKIQTQDGSSAMRMTEIICSGMCQNTGNAGSKEGKSGYSGSGSVF